MALDTSYLNYNPDTSYMLSRFMLPRGKTRLRVAPRKPYIFDNQVYYVKNKAMILKVKALVTRLEIQRKKLLWGNLNIKHPNFLYKLKVHAKKFKKIQAELNKYSTQKTGWRDLGVKI